MAFPGGAPNNAKSSNGLYAASNNVKISVPFEAINTAQKNELLYTWYATNVGEVKISVDLKCSGLGTSPVAFVYAVANLGVSSSSAQGTVIWSNTEGGTILNTTTQQGTEYGGDTLSTPWDSTILAQNATTTYTTYTTILRVQRPGPIFFILRGTASAGATSLNCAAKNLTISYDMVG